MSTANLLIAYPYLKDMLQDVHRLCSEQSVRLLVDSGAFTAWKSGQPIPLDDYCRFIESMPVKPWRYFALDVIGDPHGTMKNYETMLRRGFNPIPIFTRGEDVSVLEDYYKHSDVVGIGGLVGTENNIGFVKGIMRHIGARRCHWLGFTQLPFIAALKPYSCDSSSWEGAARYGQVALYLGRGKFKALRRDDFAVKQPDEIERCIRSYGQSSVMLRRDDSWRGGRSIARHVSAGSYLRYSAEIERQFSTMYFLAIAAADGLAVVRNMHAYLTTGATP